MVLDEIDRSLIAALRVDARQPISSLAIALDLSRATVKARIERLVERGVIQGFTIILKGDAEAHGAPVRAIAMIEVAGPSSEKVVRRLSGLPQIRAVSSTNGRWDLVAEIEVATLDEFDTILREIRQIDGITNSETSLLHPRVRR